MTFSFVSNSFSITEYRLVSILHSGQHSLISSQRERHSECMMCLHMVIRLTKQFCPNLSKQIAQLSGSLSSACACSPFSFDRTNLDSDSNRYNGTASSN